MRSTRHGSVRVNPRRSACGADVRRRSSSVTGARRRAELEAPRVVVKLEPSGVEGELVPVPEPPGDARHQAARQVLPRVEEHHPRAAEQPLEAARGEEVDPARVHIHRYLPHRLVGVDQAERAARVATAQLRQRGPPHVVPGGRPALLPEIEELGDAPASPLPQRAQRAGIEVDLVPEDRELAPIVGERMGAGLAGRREATCERHRRSIYRTSGALDTARAARLRDRACKLQGAMRNPTSWPSLSLRLPMRALAHPRLAVDLLRLAWSFRARGGFRRPPFLPLPPREYLRWRMVTAYGDEP